MPTAVSWSTSFLGARKSRIGILYRFFLLSKAVAFPKEVSSALYSIFLPEIQHYINMVSTNLLTEILRRFRRHSI